MSFVRGGFRHGRLFALLVAAGTMAACTHSPKAAPRAWDPKAAATYLDEREASWMGWIGAQRDHQTFCVSCHTVVPYALSRPSLREVLGEQGPSQDERDLIDDVTKRVRLWNQVQPYYADEGYGNGKPAESRGTEAVLNALILARQDAEIGHLSSITRAAFSNMWALQLASGESRGAWPWLQFNMEPWEARDSQYYGAALAAIAVGMAPEDYRSSPEIQNNLAALRDYLTRNAAKQSMMNRVVLLWASTKLPGLIDAEKQKSLIEEIRGEQRPDGGWDLPSHAYPGAWSLHSIVRRRWRSDWSRQSADADGYATGLIAFVLQEAGIPPSDTGLQRALNWLANHQNPEDGSWLSVSLTQQRKTSNMVGHFMRDAATAYAVLALSKSGASSVHAARDPLSPHPEPANTASAAKR